jgi:hypothetical protein
MCYICATSSCLMILPVPILSAMMSLAKALAVFGLKEVPTTQAILESRFRQLAIKTHPDKARPGDAKMARQLQQQFNELDDAKLVLMDHLEEPPKKKPRGQDRGVIRGSVGIWSICGTWIKQSTGEEVVVSYNESDGKFAIVDTQFNYLTKIDVDAINNHLVYFTHKGSITLEEGDVSIHWSNGNSWILTRSH